MKNLILFCFCIITLSACSQNLNDLNLKNLKGQVKKISTYSVNFEKKGDKIIIEERDKFGGLFWEYTYTTDGFEDTTYVKHSDNSIWVYAVNYYSKIGKPDSSLTFQPNDSILQIEYYSYNGDSVTISLFDNGEMLEQNIEIYNERGYPIKNIQLSDKKRETWNEYNNQNQLIYRKHSGYSDGDTTETFYKYNSNSDEIKETEKTKGAPEIVYDYKYEYDKNKNWTFLYIYQDNKLSKVVKRDIFYY